MRNEAKLVASSLSIEIKLFRDGNSTAKKRTRFQYEDTPDKNVNEMNKADKPTEEGHFRKHIFYVVLDSGLRSGHASYALHDQIFRDCMTNFCAMRHIFFK